MTTAQHFPAFTIHDRCRKARELAGLTQEQLAEDIGVSPRTISRYESGAISNPRRIVLKQWAARCGVSYEALAGNPQMPGGDGWAARDSNPEPAGSLLAFDKAA